MRDVYDQADRAGASPAAPEPEREWTDRAALARAVAQTTSREEAIALVAAWDLPPIGRTRRDRIDADGSRALTAVAAVGGPPRPRPRDERSGPLFTRSRGGA